MSELMRVVIGGLMAGFLAAAAGEWIEWAMADVEDQEVRDV